jgi:hypothetical protein
MRATGPAYLVLLDLITQIKFDEKYKSWSSSLCSLLYSPVTSSALDQNIFLITIFSKDLSLLVTNSITKSCYISYISLQNLRLPAFSRDITFLLCYTSLHFYMWLGLTL